MPGIDNDGLSSADARITTLEGRATTAESRMTALEAALTVAEGVVTTLQTSGNFYTKTEANALLAGKAAASHTHTASDINNSTLAGRALLTAADVPAQRTALSLGSAALANTGSFEASGSIAAHNALTTVHAVGLAPKAWKLTYIGSDNKGRSVTLTTQPADTTTWLSLFPAATGFEAAPASLIATDWMAAYSTSLGAFIAYQRKVDYVAQAGAASAPAGGSGGAGDF